MTKLQMQQMYDQIVMSDIKSFLHIGRSIL